MLRFAADENLNYDIVRALLRRRPALDITRVQDAGLSGVEDPEILGWAAREGRVLITHDVATITHYAHDRVKQGKPMPGVFEVGRSVALKQAVDDLLLLCECSLPDEWEGRILYLPLR